MSVEKLTPYDHQEQAIRRMLAEPTKSILMADEMGQGKTLSSVEFALRGGFQRVLVIGVKDSYHQFNERLQAQSDGRHSFRRLDSTKAGRAAFADFMANKPGFFFTGSQWLRAQDWAHAPKMHADGSPLMLVDKKTGLDTGKQVTEPKHLRIYARLKPLDLIVFDEVHMAANRKSAVRRTLTSIKSEWKLGMSGTWSGNGAEGMWSITRWLWPDRVVGRFYEWRDEWCQTREVFIAGGKTATEILGEKVPGAYVRTLPCYLRTEAPEQPPAAELVYVDLAPKQRQQYDDVERDMLTYIETHEGLVAKVADLPITQRSLLRTAALGEMALRDGDDVFFAPDCESSKLRAMRGILDSWGDQRAAIFTHSKRFAKVVVARMQAAGYKAVEWSGDVPSKRRDEIKAAFLAGQVQYIVAVIGAFREALDGFQTVCNRVLWLSEIEGDTVANSQALGRFFRPGRTLENGGFHHVKLLARGTHDEGVYSALLMNRLRMRATLAKQAA